MTSTKQYTHAHMFLIEDSSGDLVDAKYFCSDWCHHGWCAESGNEYKGWNGLHEVHAPQLCEYCGDSI